MLRIFLLAIAALAGWAPACAAAEAHGGFDGAALGLVWVGPFAGMLLSIAFLPLLAPHLWEHHFGKVSAFWAAAILIPFAAEFGGYVTLVQLAHTVLREYLPFMILLFSLFVVAGGIRVVGNLVGTPGTNTAMLGSTLTLPGIAGFVLTIGTAVDANVLINERIREERRRGRSVLQSLELGYKEASRTIFEANVTHAIAGGIMLILGSGPIRGFAVVLLLGIASSVFTAVTFTRMLVAGWMRRHRPTDITI